MSEDRTCHENAPVCVVGLIADPGLAADVAESLLDSLPEVLAREVRADVQWCVRLVRDAVPIDEHGYIRIVDAAEERMPAEGWDMMVCLTELPRRVGTRPVVLDVSSTHKAALASLPAIGWFRLRPHVRDILVYLIAELAGLPNRHGTAEGHRRRGQRIAAVVSPVRHVRATDETVDVYLALAGLRGRARLLFGMVRNNRPWRLVPYLASAVAAATAGAAFGVFYGSIWRIADALSPERLVTINVLALAMITIWLIVYNSLWDSPRRGADPEMAALYNASTALTVILGVSFAYLLLFLIVSAVAAVVIDSSLLQARLGHPVDWVDYAEIAWLASSMGTVAGALGSSFESENAVRAAAYSRREQDRQARRRQQADDASASGDT